MTAKAGKRIRAARAAVDARRVYAVAEAIDAVKGGDGKTKFDETVEAALQLGVDTRKSDQAVRGATVMPAGTGRVVRVAVLAPEEDHEAATAAGADIVGGDDLIAAIRNGEIRFDILIAKPEMMRALAAVGKILGPKGLNAQPQIWHRGCECRRPRSGRKAGKSIFAPTKRASCMPRSARSLSPPPICCATSKVCWMPSKKRARRRARGCICAN